MKKGLFITLEGIEGVGKSTHMAYITTQLEQAGHKVVQTREPGGTAAGEAIREIVLNGKDLNIAAETELLLIFGARAQHLTEIICPALTAGKIVLCDRFTDATYAYQGGGRNIDINKITVLEQQVQGELRPDLSILFDAPVSVGLARAKNRSAADRFESETIDFFERVRKNYLDIAEKEPERVRLIDASGSLQEVEITLKRLLQEKRLC